MRTALYGRYSTDKQRDASIEDQFRTCEQFAEREGWSIATRYKDAGIREQLICHHSGPKMGRSSAASWTSSLSENLSKRTASSAAR